MDLVDVILLLAAAIMFGLAALLVTTRRVDLVSLGLLLWVTVPLIHAIDVIR